MRLQVHPEDRRSESLLAFWRAAGKAISKSLADSGIMQRKLFCANPLKR